MVDFHLEQRLLRFLNREDAGERRSMIDLRSLPPDERELEGECIQRARLVARDGGEVLTFEAPENLSKFRPGDALLVGDGEDFENALPVVYRCYDARTGRLELELDRFASVDRLPEEGEEYCIDRRSLGLHGRLQELVRAGFATPGVREALEGGRRLRFDRARERRARDRLGRRGRLNDEQLELAARAIACEDLVLVQGPPGTGKTRMLAEAVAALCGAGCRVALCAFTHRAVDNALRALRRADPALTLVKAGWPRASDEELRRAGVRFVSPRRGRLPRGSAVVAGTPFALSRLCGAEAFHYTFFDEAGQMPIPHAIAGMLLSSRWVLVGDHRQLPPVVTAHHADQEVTASVFEHLHRAYGGEMLEVTYRMNEDLCRVVGETFYDGRLRSAPAAAGRRMPFRPGGALDSILRPDRPAVLARLEHRRPGMRSPEEAELVAALVAECTDRHGVSPEEIAVISPFRAQVRAIRSALDGLGSQAAPSQTVVVDTVERMQGQERDVVILSLACGDPETLRGRGSFCFSEHRINVAVSRARTKAVIVASAGAFRALPSDPVSLRAASLLRRLRGKLHETAAAQPVPTQAVSTRNARYIT